jgi:hypothetical protein
LSVSSTVRSLLFAIMKLHNGFLDRDKETEYSAAPRAMMLASVKNIK